MTKKLFTISRLAPGNALRLLALSAALLSASALAQFTGFENTFTKTTQASGNI